MNISVYIKKLLGLDLNDDHLWLDSEVVSNLDTDSFIDNTQIVEGHNHCNLILRPNVNLEIAGNFTGKIVGQGNNVVRIRGVFEGIVLSNKTIVLEDAVLEGKVYSSQFVVSEDCDFTGTVHSLPIPFLGIKIDFEYIEKLS